MQGTENQTQSFFDSKVLGHPAGLFVLFFTEMWERFSFYGMRVLLFSFLTMTAIGYNPGWEWSSETAGALFGTYAMLLYLTPILGGIIADKVIGYRWAVVVGSIIMTAGHAAMAFETEFSLYLGLTLLVIGTGFFKPTMTSIISEMYKDLPEKKDGAYTIFYMGVNAGAFFGMMLCGYLAERIGWSWGFGLAGIFMLLGTLQFWLAKPLFGKIGEVPQKQSNEISKSTPIKAEKSSEKEDAERRNPFTRFDITLIVICAAIGLLYAINDPLSKIAGIDLFSFAQISTIEGQYIAVLFGLALFLVLVISRISRYTKLIQQRMIAFIIFAFFTVFFWMSFEQGATSLVNFARDSVQRVLEGNWATFYSVINGLIAVIPLGIITYVLILLGKRTGKVIPGSNIVLVFCFSLVWSIVGWMIYRDFNTTAYEIKYASYKSPVLLEDGTQKIEDGKPVFDNIPITISSTGNPDNLEIEDSYYTLGEPFVDLKKGDEIFVINKDQKSKEFNMIVGDDKLAHFKERGIEVNRDNGIIKAEINEVKSNWVEVPYTWFSILNSFFIIAFASLFTKWWDSKYNPSATTKYALGLIVMAIGFGLLAFGTYGIEEGVKVSMIWLILAYLFHTLGELCISPVGLSYVSKLVPARMIAFMFGMWYLAIAIGNKLAAVLGGQVETITKEYSLSRFFLIFTIVPIVAGVIIYFLKPVLKKLMHGVK